MVAYVIFLRESPVHTPAEMEEYQRMGRERPADPRLTPLAVYGAQVELEGKAPDGAVILRFPSMEAAKDWYYGDYLAAAEHRQKAAEYRGFIVDGFTLPGS